MFRSKVIPWVLVVIAAIALITIAVSPNVSAEADSVQEPSGVEVSKPALVTTAAPSTTSTTSTLPATTTTTYVPFTISADAVVVGDSLAAAGVLLALQERGVDVLWIPETGYTGGQASAAGVSSMDEQDVSGLLSRDVWPYSGMVDALRETRRGPDENAGVPYFGRDRRFQEFGPTPLEVREYLDAQLVDVPRIEFDVVEVLSWDRGIIGVADVPGNIILTNNLVDATEFQDLYPLVEGLSWEVPQCVQNTTWTAVRHEDSTTYPGYWDDESVRAAYGDDVVDGWLDGFRSQVTVDGRPFFEQWDDWGPPWSPYMEWQYRAVASNYSHVNNNGTDHGMTPEAITDEAVREVTLLAAKDKMFLWLWYQRWELGVEGFGIATDLGYQDVDQAYWSDVIPDDFEELFTPYPYVRQGRTLSDPVMTWETIKVRGEVREDATGLLWGYMADSHGCTSLSDETSSGYGLFEMVPEIFVQDEVPGFWPGMARGARVDAVVASSVRMQPSEYIGGYFVGTLIAEALEG